MAPSDAAQVGTKKKRLSADRVIDGAVALADEIGVDKNAWLTILPTNLSRA